VMMVKVVSFVLMVVLLVFMILVVVNLWRWSW